MVIAGGVGGDARCTELAQDVGTVHKFDRRAESVARCASEQATAKAILRGDCGHGFSLDNETGANGSAVFLRALRFAAQIQHPPVATDNQAASGAFDGIAAVCFLNVERCSWQLVAGEQGGGVGARGADGG